MPRRTGISLLLALACTCGASGSVAAQKPKCHVVCAPVFTLRPEWIRSHLFTQPRVQDLKTGAISRLRSRNNLDLLFLVGVPTRVPGLALYADASWLPTAQAGSNPFTDYSAGQLGDTVRANIPTLAAGISYTYPTNPAAHWIAATPYVGDVLSKAGRPGAASDYTHKLDMGLFLNVGAFAWLPPKTWLHHLRAEATLDYIATGLPRAGDVLPAGTRRFLDDAHGASLQLGLILPVAPQP